MERIQKINKGYDENLWYIFGDAYDLKEFYKIHPGGKEALMVGQGRDCTNIILSYHFRNIESLIPVIEKYRTGEKYDPYNEYEKRRGETPLEKDLKSLVQSNVDPTVKLHVLLVGILSYAGMWVSIAFLIQGSYLAAVLAPIFGWLPTCLLSHDGGHFACFKSESLNRIMRWTSFPLYYNSATWMITHICSHHPFVNDSNRDADMYHGYGVARMSEDQEYASYMSRTVRFFLFFMQMFFATFAESIRYPILCLWDYFLGTSTIFLVVPNKDVVVKKLFSELVIQLAVSTSIILVPFFNDSLTWYQKLFLAFAPFNIGSVIFIYATQFSHLSTTPQKYTKKQHLYPDSNHGFAEKQILRSLDINPKSSLLNFISGGLNLQSLHHVFPKVHNSRFLDIYDDYVEVCKRHSTNPNHTDTLIEGMKSYFQEVIRINTSSTPENMRLVSAN